MERALTRWLRREQEWSNERDQRKKKELILWMVAVPVVAIAITILPALFAGGGIADGLQRVKYTMIIAVVLDLLLIVGMLPQMPGRQYMKYLKIYLDRSFSSDSEREELAAQMLGERGADSVICIPWKESGIGEQRVWVTKDYLISTRGNGRLDLVFLNQVKTIETDRKDITYRAGDRETRINVKDQLFTIDFIYQENAALDEEVREFRDKHVKLSYFSRELRDKVLAAVQTMRQEQK